MILASKYESGIDWVLRFCPDKDKFAHTYAGLALWLIAMLMMRKKFGSWNPLIVVMFFELANEIIDRIAHGAWVWVDTSGDIAATLFWPLLLTLVARFVIVKDA